MFDRNSLKAMAIAGALMVPGAAFAQSAQAIVTADLNIRTGPSTDYQRFDTIPNGSNVVVNDCLTGYNWCDVDWAGTRGWVSGNYLAYLGDTYYRQPISRIGVSIGLPIVSYDFDDYNRRYYHGRYHRNHRRAVREIRRERRQEARHDRREHRQEVRQHQRQEARQDRRQHRQAVRQQQRQQARQQQRRQQARQQQRRQHRQEVRQQQRQQARQQQRRQHNQQVRQQQRQRAHAQRRQHAGSARERLKNANPGHRHRTGG